MSDLQTMAEFAGEVPAPKEMAAALASELAPGQRVALGLALLRLRLKEHLTSESVFAKRITGLAGYTAARFLGACGLRRQEFLILSKLHRADCPGPANGRAERLAREAAAGSNPAVTALYRDHTEQVTATPRTAHFVKDPARLLGPVAMVLKSPAGGEKGVVLLQYSHTFPLFASKFDLDRITARYYLVLEPDWSGYCDVNVLSYSRYPSPVFVQAYEPRDAALIAATRSNLVAVPTSTNWWVDHRLFRPLPDVRKDMDVVMVAGWGAYKRHHRFFAALGRLRRDGRRLRVLLLGYPIGLTREDILRRAAYYGVADQLELHEWIPYEEVNGYINRARVNVIWSRKEGVNRAIIEGMFAGVPCLVRDGFNYGFRYPYINPQTGEFASERGLSERLLWMIDHASEFAPRQWVSAHMSCQRATEILSAAIGNTAAARSEPWSGGLAVKVNKLHAMVYWDPWEAQRFEPDYAFLRSTIRA